MSPRAFCGVLLVFVSSLVLAGPTDVPDQQSLAQGLDGWWNFDSCQLMDSSPIKREIIRGGQAECAQGKIRSGMRFRGVKGDDYLEVVNTPPMRFTKGFSINLWFLILGHDSHNGNREVVEYGTQSLIGKLDDRTGLAVRLERSPEDGLWYAYIGNGRCCERKQEVIPRVPFGQGGVRLQAWTMLTVVYDPDPEVSLIRLYVNGVLKAAEDAEKFDLNPQTDAEALMLGADRRGLWYPLNGVIDEVRIYSRPISSLEIGRLQQRHFP